MEIFSTPWWSALLAIILIDLVLAGDNAIVIALAARKLPKYLQKRAMLWGTVGAVVVRSLMTLGVVWLLRIPGLMLLGGLALLWIAYRLLAAKDDKTHDTAAASSFAAAMRTIIVADALMGIDNVLGVAGAAHGEFALVIIGLLVSVPIVISGSTLVLKLVERFPLIINIGAAVLALTAAKMIISEPLLESWYRADALSLSQAGRELVVWVTYAFCIGGVLAAGWWASRHAHAGRARTFGHGQT